jgi:asparagine synthase (glutamine-hydrolysing)
MPGIVGIITERPRAWAQSKLEPMVASLRHDASYGTGTWSHEGSGTYIGWAARKGSFCDRMPLENEAGDLSLFFAGEEYPDPATRQRLGQGGHARNGHGLQSHGSEDHGSNGHHSNNHAADYLVHLYEEQPDFPARLNGRFHGFVHDRRHGTATAMLFNDRFSMHRVYFHQSKNAFYFAPEAKAILSACPELKSLNLRSLGEFVSCGCVLENRTLFEGIEILPPASAWRFEHGELQRGRYFNPGEWEAQERLSAEAYYRELREAFSANLERYFEGDEKIGMSLTGGLDSRMILAWRKFAPGSLPCYSFGGSYRDCEDVVLARRLASMCGQTHEIIPVGREFLAGFSAYAERTVYLTDGAVDVTRAPDLFVNERARQIAPVRMTGNYGSEVLRWVPAFKPGEPMPGLYHQDFLTQVRAARDTYSKVATGHPVSFAVFRQAPWHHYGLLGLEQTQVTVRSPFLDNDFVRTAFRAPKAELSRNGPANTDICLRLIAEGNQDLGRLRSDRGLGAGQNTLAGRLQHQYLEFTFKAEYAYDYGMPQWVAQVDHALSPLHLERLFLGRHKFYHFRIWYRDALADYVRQMLLDSRTLARPYLEPTGVEQIVAGHLKGNRNYTNAIHKVLTLELIHRLFLD